MNEINTLRNYYDRRADEYDAIYERNDPRRQRELQALAAAAKRTLTGRCVLEIACGTGYWTAIVAPVAVRILATDCSTNMLALAREKPIPPDKVEFRSADAYALSELEGTFDGGLANFWLSHVPTDRLDEFLDGFHARLEPGAAVFMADNMLVPEVGGELTARPGVVDTFKLRKLSDGSEHEILKNYHDEDALRRIVQPYARDVRVTASTCFWWMSYTSV